MPEQGTLGRMVTCMQQIFSTADHSSRDGFKRWQDLLDEQLTPIEVKRLNDSPFQAEFAACALGPFPIFRLRQGALLSETNAAGLRRHARPDTVMVILKQHGEATSVQDGRESVQRAGDILLLDRRPSVVTTHTDSQALFIEVPRERLENALGSTRRYTSLTVGAPLASTQMATSFIQNLVQLNPQLAADSAIRMARSPST